MMLKKTNSIPLFSSPALIVIAIFSTQLSAVLAKQLLNVVGNLGAISLNFSFAAILLLLWYRPRLQTQTRQSKLIVIVMGLVLAGMYLCLYGAIERIPLGIAVAVQFSGPLGLSATKSSRRLDFIWVFLAAMGIVLLSPFGQSIVDPIGVLLAFVSGLLLATYIILAKKVAINFAKGEGLALAISVGAVVLLPASINAGTELLTNPNLLLVSLGVAILSAVVPFSLDSIILKRTSTKTFGILLSLEPAIASLLGFIFLNQYLSFQALIGIALIMVSTIGQSQFAKDC